MNIKYIIAIAAAALMLPGCDRTDLETSSLSDGNVRIKVSGLQLTKGTLINSEEEMLTAGVDEFTVQAWNADYSSFVTKQAVRYNTTESKWQTASPIAWTGTDSKTFFASANLPASGATVTNTCTSTGQKQTLEYTLPLDARSQNDVMLGWYGGNGGGVQTADITFVHPLSSIILKRGEMEIDGIKSITVSGLYASGTVDVTYSKLGETVVPAYNWGSSRTGSVVSTLEPEEGQSVITVADDGTIGTPFVVIPQPVVAGRVKICVSVIVSGKDKSLVVNVPAGAFEAGKTHVFTLGYSNRDLLPGKFSVSVTEYVQFSRGNLFCTRSGSEGSYSYTFGFESNQYDYRCRNGESQDKAVINGSVTTTPSQTSGLFQWIERNSTRAGGDWGAFTRYSGADSYDAYGDVLDFGGVFPESDWTTLTQVQWQYLLDHHTYKHITVNGVYGLAIAPDGYEGAISASYDSSSWSVEEGKGVVFLPLYGYGNFGTNKIETHEYCYWSLTSSAEADQGKNWAIALHSRDNAVVVDSRWRTYAQNVRLVQTYSE